MKIHLLFKEQPHPGGVVAIVAFKSKQSLTRHLERVAEVAEWVSAPDKFNILGLVNLYSKNDEPSGCVFLENGDKLYVTEVIVNDP